MYTRLFPSESGGICNGGASRPRTTLSGIVHIPRLVLACPGARTLGFEAEVIPFLRGQNFASG